MGAVYSVALKIKVKDEQGAINALRAKVNRGEEERTRYHEDDLESALGHPISSLEDFMRLFLCDRGDGSFITETENDFLVFRNDFDCCYAWETVMLEMFNELAPYLEDCSYIHIAPDNSHYKYEVKEGKVFFSR